MPSLENRDANYKALAAICVKEDFAKADGVVSRILAINSDNGAANEIKKTYNAIIDKQQLIIEIDNQLKNLVTNYDVGEEALREEETYLNFVKEFKGDEVRAKRAMSYIKAQRKDDPVDLVSRLRAAISEVNQPASAKKTAVILLKDYIIDAYNEYVSETKDVYPESIKLKITDTVSTVKGARSISWNGSTVDGSNFAELKKQLESKYENEKNIALSKIKPNFLAIFPGCLFLGIPTYLTFKNTKQKKDATIAQFNKQKTAKVKLLEQALKARGDANIMVSEFYAKENWNQLDLKEETENG